MTSVSATQSILGTLKQLLAADEESNLYSEWQTVLRNLGISDEVRNLGDEWFTKSHQFRQERAEKSKHEISQDNTTEEELFKKILQHVHEKINSTSNPIKKWNLKDQLSNLQSLTPEEWIEKAYQCVVEETILIEKYRKLNAESEVIQKAFELLYLKLQEKKRVLGEMLEGLEREGQKLKQAKQSHQETLHHAQQLQYFIDAQGTPINGTESRLQQARELVREKEENLEQQIHSFQATVMDLKEKLEEIYENARELIKNLLYEVKQWQHEFKLTYAELAGNMDLDRFAPCCARTGEMLRDLLRTDMIRLENVINDVTGDGKSECDTLIRKFDDLLAWFYQSTFLVTKQDGGPKQDPWNIKKSLARTPKITLRILGADTLDALGGVEVHACFLLESLINEHYNCDEGILDFDAMESDSWRIKNSKLTKFVQQRSNNSVQQRIHEVTFNIELHVSLNRSKTINVYKEKYRLVFWTQLDNKRYWTMSLPMVVTTGGNQNCQCLASVMWQCFSTDVFTIPTEPLPTMPWSEVTEMLQAKIQNLSSKWTLSEDNINHLKERLLGSADVPDDKQVSLEEFCSVLLPQEVPANETEEKEEFTFWMWYLSVYNLIKTYLIDFWNNGWIEGFLSKEMAVRKLTESKTYKPGTLLLRFSDQHIDKSQGKDTVFGKLATSLLIKNNGQCPEVRHVDTIGHDKLAVMHLADVLLQTVNNSGQNLYRYLYQRPDTLCTILFQGYQRKAQVPVAGHGYVGVKNVFQADLEQLDEDFSKLELRGKRRLSGNHNNSPEETQEDTDEMTNFEVKRLKSNESEKIPLLLHNLDDLDDTSIIVNEVDKSPIVVAKGNTLDVQTDIGTDAVNMIGGEMNMATKTNMAQERTRMMGHETNIMSENAEQKATLPGYKRRDTCDSSVLRKLLTEELDSAVTNTSLVITQTKNSNSMYTKNTEQIENGSYKNIESENTANKDNSPTTQNEGQSSSATIRDNQNVSVSLLNTASFMEESCNTQQRDRILEPGIHPSIEPNDQFEASHIANSVFAEPGGIQTQSTNNQAMVPTAMQYVLSDEKAKESIQEYLIGLPPEKAVDTLKPFLESLAPHYIMKITPIKKIILEIITPFLKTLSPELNQMVIQALQNSIEESQSLETANQTGSSEEDSAAAGLGQTELTPAEIADGLSVPESDILHMETFDFESQM